MSKMLLSCENRAVIPATSIIGEIKILDIQPIYLFFSINILWAIPNILAYKNSHVKSYGGSKF